MNKLNAVIISLMLVWFSSNTLARTAPPTPVHTEEVAIHQVSQSLSLIGKLQSKQFVSIASEVSAKVIKINVEANQKVKKGQLLIELDASKANALLAEANAYLIDEKRKLKEYQLLIKKQAITQTEYNAQLATVEIANARLLAAQVLVDNHSIMAPFSGTIGLIDFSEGKLVSVGETLLTLDNLAEMTLDLPVPERYLSMLNVGMDVSAVSRAWKNTTFTGYVKAVDSRVNSDTLNLRVRLLFNNNNEQLKPGMMLSSTLVFDAIDAPIIPVQALEYSGTKRFVYVLKEAAKAPKEKKADSAETAKPAQKGRAGQKGGANTKAYTVERRQVVLGARIGDQVLIESGLELGERIVVQGLVNMRDGLNVTDLTQATASTEKDAK
ncbi:efflux RND transporter periplasmic adaptor subunit [Psychromonas sp. RZ5]|uniref:efflux RND transporter periplasmic adaptor subunit n=1 Tax=Psychromonas algicola TaxID=2555642 RepID=UPI0010679E87|nr:efflux RND transporter periplasmic adaptor subunit [Psychromonas sp. RZ5]TEW52324.1 efflux RND transporter periplasmic adaptor subunit [Psychromonas sp. RZ5]